jgi:ferritin-like metal-binding protein YciE
MPWFGYSGVALAELKSAAKLFSSAFTFLSSLPAPASRICPEHYGQSPTLLLGILNTHSGGYMETAHELFLHELQDMLDAERRLVEALGKQSEESSRSELSTAFSTHQRQTEKQVQRLEQAFESLGEEAEETECAGIKGLIEEHDKFTEEDPSPDILDVFNIGAAEKIESYEICAYESLLELANSMDHKEAARLISQNLKEEQQTLKKMQTLSKKIKPERTGMEEEAEAAEEQKHRSTRRRRAA